MVGCPSHQDLQRFIEGPGDVPEAASVATHLEGCSACQQAVATLRGNLPATLLPQGDTRPTEATEIGAEDFLRRLSKENESISGIADEPGVEESFGRYRLIRQLGAGGMGSVWLAHDTELDRDAAVKVPILDPFDTTGRERFRQEGRAAARLEHPNIARVYDVGEVKGVPYLAMECISGPTLAARLATGRLPVQEAIQLTIAIARGLHHAHAAGVIHRDLKPANILLRPIGESPFFEPKITDFGLARRLDDPTGLTRTGAMMGTPAYMSPEQAGGHWDEVGPASDQFSLGVVLYEMLTGQRPFRPNMSDMRNQPAYQVAPTPSRVASRAEPMPDDIVCRALAPNPADRFPSVAEMADQLEAWLRSPPRPTRRIRRRTAVIGLALAAVALATTLIVVGRGHRDPPPLEPEIRNGIGMDLVRIDPGTFLMGSREGEIIYPNEGPAHEVEITRPFYLARTEVTVGQFRRFVEETNYKTVAELHFSGGTGYDSETNDFDYSDKFNWRNPGFAQTDDHPVVLVSWVDAQAFCAWLSRVEGRHYRLPTEAEWEYACRAGTTTAYWWGDDENGLRGRANLADISLRGKLNGVDEWTMNWDDQHPFTAQVGSFAPNPWGLRDVTGNVDEWCEDWAGPYPAERQRDPTGPATGTKRILRGGSWNRGPDACRSTDRAEEQPTDCLCYVGFRVAMDP